MAKTILTLDGRSLILDDIKTFADTKAEDVQVALSPASVSAIKKARAFVLDKIKEGRPVYGINTGFGALSDQAIGERDLEKLQLNLVRSHCTGVGPLFDERVVRTLMLLRANCLCSGHSGVSLKVVESILHFLNCGITPLIPSQGSVGASGDLAPLSHMALCLIGEGEVQWRGQTLNAAHAIQKTGGTPLVLGPKDGLALLNGTTAMAALGGLAVVEARELCTQADICASLTLEGIKGTPHAYAQALSELRPHPGQLESSSNLLRLLKESPIAHSHRNCKKVQDPYSLRCVPQVHGASRQAMHHCASVISTELNAVTDNPLVFPESGEIISGGNFHGQTLGLSMDYLAMGVSELGSISERRIEKMTNPTFSGLPAFLTERGGLNSGVMIAQYTAAALASENKGLCHPASVDSIPTSNEKEDHVSMGVTAGRKLHQVLENTRHILAIELLCNTQALEFQRPLKSTPALERAFQLVRSKVPKLEADRTLHRDIQTLACMIKEGELLDAVEAEIGELQ